MELISKTLFWVANSLLIPDIILLLILFFRALVLLVQTYNMFMVRRKAELSLDALIKAGDIAGLRQALPAIKAKSLYINYINDLLALEKDEAYAEFLLNKFENEAEKDLATSRLLSKIGPVLGLIGTLISMSPALVGLSTGDISGMAFNMQVVFSTTVVGLVISMVGLLSAQLKQRWYDKSVNNLEYVSKNL